MTDSQPLRLAIYYGYPSLVNGSSGDVDKAARVFAAYRTVVLGDGVEFPDRQPSRYPQGDPGEHRKAADILLTTRQINPLTEFYGYVCLGDISSSQGNTKVLPPEELKERFLLWKQMGVTGIFLDEAGYDFPTVTRARQNVAIQFIHELGMRAFVNAYFVDHLFSQENSLPNAAGSDKNPNHTPTLLDDRDAFLLESFQIKNGRYEDGREWRGRMEKALAYRKQFGTRIFATTTTPQGVPFLAAQFDYARWTAALYSLDGFAWGEPDFSALDNRLPDRFGSGDSAIDRFPSSSRVNSDGQRFWRRAGEYVVVVDTINHSVRRVVAAEFVKSDHVQSGRQGLGRARIPSGSLHELQAN